MLHAHLFVLQGGPLRGGMSGYGWEMVCRRYQKYYMWLQAGRGLFDSF